MQRLVEALNAPPEAVTAGPEGALGGSSTAAAVVASRMAYVVPVAHGQRGIQVTSRPCAASRVATMSPVMIREPARPPRPLERRLLLGAPLQAAHRTRRQVGHLRAVLVAGDAELAGLTAGLPEIEVIHQDIVTRSLPASAACGPCGAV
jgi:hypothetical protein